MLTLLHIPGCGSSNFANAGYYYRGHIVVCRLSRRSTFVRSTWIYIFIIIRCTVRYSSLLIYLKRVCIHLLPIQQKSFRETPTFVHAFARSWRKNVQVRRPFQKSPAPAGKRKLTGLIRFRGTCRLRIRGAYVAVDARAKNIRRGTFVNRFPEGENRKRNLNSGTKFYGFDFSLDKVTRARV